jgi:hypothetical protein
VLSLRQQALPLQPGANQRPRAANNRKPDWAHYYSYYLIYVVHICSTQIVTADIVPFPDELENGIDIIYLKF